MSLYLFSKSEKLFITWEYFKHNRSSIAHQLVCPLTLICSFHVHFFDFFSFIYDQYISIIVSTIIIIIIPLILRSSKWCNRSLIRLIKKNFVYILYCIRFISYMLFLYWLFINPIMTESQILGNIFKNFWRVCFRITRLSWMTRITWSTRISRRHIFVCTTYIVIIS